MYEVGQLVYIACNYSDVNLYSNIILTKHYVGGKSQS